MPTITELGPSLHGAVAADRAPLRFVISYTETEGLVTYTAEVDQDELAAWLVPQASRAVVG
jgi:hypothetical protein